MKLKFLKAIVILGFIFTLVSCSSNEADQPKVEQKLVVDYTYNSDEIELAKIINDYRVSIGLNQLNLINHVSFKSEEHDLYMIANNVVDHAFFQDRVDNLVSVLGATRVNENVAYNFNTPQAVLTSWLNSPEHKSNIEGNFTDFGISVKVSETTGKKYYTNIFIKK